MISKFDDPMSSRCQTLPAELLHEIARGLAWSYSLDSVPSFNATCRHIYQTTLPALYRKLILLKSDPESLLPQPVPVSWFLKETNFKHTLEAWKSVW